MKRIAVRRTAVLLGLLVVATAGTVSTVVAPATAAPTPSAVEAQIDKEWNALEPTIEQYNQVHSQLRTNQAQQKKLAKTLAPLQKEVDAALSNVGDMAANAYMRGGPSAMSSMLMSGSADSLTEKLTFLNELARHQREQVADVTVLRDRYAADKRELDSLTESLATRDADLAARKKTIEKKIDDLQKLRIKAYGENGGATGSLRTGPCPAEYTNDKGGKAAKKACSLIGKPYIWAAEGPGGYDCSGLTLTAWASVGVSLKHYTKAQYGQTTPVSRADLKPGDLVFYYSDLHHMGIYVGDGTIVHAPHTGDHVRMAPIDRSPVAGYRRPR